MVYSEKTIVSAVWINKGEKVGEDSRFLKLTMESLM